MPIDYTPPSHYEYSIPHECNVLTIQENRCLNDQIKNRAFQYMNKLEGWCTKYKASTLIDYVCLLQPEIIVEIGVFGGKSLVPMACALQENGHGVIYGVDPWSSVESSVGMDGVNLEWWSHVDHTKILRGLQDSIKEFSLNDQIRLIQATSLDAPEIHNIDMLHIDGNHSDETSYIDVIKWVPLVRSGGLVIFDDVNWSTTSRAVEWLNENCVPLAQYRGDNIWGIWIKP